MGESSSSEGKGIIPRLVSAIFYGIEHAAEHIEFTLKLAYVEIYNEKIRDLLTSHSHTNKNNNLPQPGESLKIREGSRGVYIEGVTESYVASEQQVIELMALGNQNRATSSTLMNEQSSRSHSVFILTLGQLDTRSGSKKGSKLTLVDLAGSEKVLKTGAAGQTLTEAKSINKSLSALGNVINALSTAQTHIPYRDSKLTRLLSDSLGGNSKTCLIITCSPMSYNVEETLSTLRFGIRAKLIKNKPKMNQEKSIGEYKKLLEQAAQQCKLQAEIIAALEGDVRVLSAFIKAQGLMIPVLSGMNGTIVVKMQGANEDETFTGNQSPVEEQQQPKKQQQESPQSPRDEDEPDTESVPIGDTSHADSSSVNTSVNTSLSSTTTSSLMGKSLAEELKEGGFSHTEDTLSALSSAGTTGVLSDTHNTILASPHMHTRHSSTLDLSSLSARFAALSTQLQELQQEKTSLLDQLADKDAELAEVIDIHHAEKELIVLQIKDLMNTIEEERKYRQSYEMLLKEYELLKKKYEVMVMEHTVQQSEWKEEKKALQEKLNEVLWELNAKRKENMDLTALMEEMKQQQQQHQQQQYLHKHKLSQDDLSIGSMATTAPSTAITVTPSAPAVATATVPAETPAALTITEPLAASAAAAASSSTSQTTASPATPSTSTTSTLNPTTTTLAPSTPPSKSTSSPTLSPSFSGFSPFNNNKHLRMKSATLKKGDLSSPLSHLHHPPAGLPPHHSLHDSLSSLPSTLNELKDDRSKVMTLTEALQKKVDQYCKLKEAYLNRADHIALLEMALSDANQKVKESQEGPQRKIAELEEKLASAEALCTRLLLIEKNNRRRTSGGAAVVIGNKDLLHVSAAAPAAATEVGGVALGDNDTSNSSNTAAAHKGHIVVPVATKNPNAAPSTKKAGSGGFDSFF